MKPRQLISRFFLFTTAMQIGYYAVIFADRNKETIKKKYKKRKK
ncbi:hypothetical protein ACFSYG_13460 [Leeuwenhoekiella polynyae]|uniref:Uncharacterized protein n=1 Tax=Leeuwenhoekiella polynyae TaxID=1550906 RepID=A0A4Q0P421_9FLAO|nr:hypothetical protein [Leeuwenhoekiella polynyae]RXG21323.1 hypothetical protein DSM02_2178 [Leeuwenhoekiella polynyae]